MKKRLAYVFHLCQIGNAMTKTIEISEQAARDMMPCLEAKLSALEQEIEIRQRDCDGLKTTIAELRTKLNNSELPLANGEALRRRRPKGFGETAIETLLKSLADGQGLTATEITKRTGLNHATVHRTLREPKRNKGRFIETENGWRMKSN